MAQSGAERLSVAESDFCLPECLTLRGDKPPSALPIDAKEADLFGSPCHGQQRSCLRLIPENHSAPGLVVVSVLLAGADPRRRRAGSRLGAADRVAAPEAAWRRGAGAGQSGARRTDDSVLGIAMRVKMCYARPARPRERGPKPERGAGSAERRRRRRLDLSKA